LNLHVVELELGRSEAKLADIEAVDVKAVVALCDTRDDELVSEGPDPVDKAPEAAAVVVNTA
jgi:hypothetical protein